MVVGTGVSVCSDVVERSSSLSPLSVCFGEVEGRMKVGGWRDRGSQDLCETHAVSSSLSSLFLRTTTARFSCKKKRDNSLAMSCPH